MPELQCPHCGGGLAVPDSLAGQTTRCPSCRGEMEVPLPPDAPVAPVAPLATKPRRKLLRRPLFYVALGAALIAVGVLLWWLLWPRELTPHRAMIGHWRRVGSRTTADKATFKAKPTKVEATELYISRRYAWRVDPGDKPVRVRYEVVEENQENFWLRKYVVTPGGEKIYSLTTFSPDRKEMRGVTRQDIGEGLPDDLAWTVRSQIGGVSHETVYRRVDDKTSP